MSDGKIIYDVDVNDEGVEGKVKKTNDKIGSAAESGSSAFSEVWTGALRTIGAKLVELGQQAVETAVDVTKESLAQVAAFEQNVGGIEKLFGESAGTVQENAKKAFKTAGMSANEYMENVTGFSAALINSLGGDTAEAAKLADVAIRSMSDNANTYGTSMESITNAYQGFAKENYTMLDNLKLGYAGTKQGMQKLIEDASKMTEVQAELGLAVDGTSMDFANCVKAIEVMQASMNIAGTTSREAAGTIEGSVNSMKAAWTDFLTGTISGEEFAETALIAVDNVVNALMEIIPRLISGLGEMAPMLLDKVLEITNGLISSLEGAYPDLMAKGGEMLSKLGEGVANGIPEFVEKAMQSILKFSQSLSGEGGKKMIEGGLKLIVSLVTGLANAVPKLIQYAPQIVLNIVKTIIENLPSVIDAGVQMIFALISGIAKTIPQLIAQFPTMIKSIFTVWKGTNWFSLGTTLITSILNGLASLVSRIPDYLRSIGNSAVNAFRSINWYGLGSNIIDGIVSGLWNGISSVVNAAREVARNALQAAKDFLWSNSPSKKFMQLGEDSTEGQAIGMLNNVEMVEDASKEVAERALDAQMNVDYDLPDIDSASRNMSANLASSFTSTVSRIIEVPLTIDSREIARATAWDMGEQLAWEMR